jgi:uncharacterized membrane protein YedE/YeeE
MNIDLQNFSPSTSLIGGVLIGLSATMTLILHGRVAGISGILSGCIDAGSSHAQRSWRMTFVAGLVLGAIPFLYFMPQKFELGIERSALELIVAGALVGIGTRLGSGCTSGHGVCGISRGSPRSLLATVTFVATGVVTVLLFNHWGCV